MWKWTKRVVLALVVGGAVGFAFLGTEVFSYGSSSVRWLKANVKDSVPIEIEIQRARDLLEDLVPEMHATIKQVAKEEVEVAVLEKEIERERLAIEKERALVQDLRSRLSSGEVAYRVGSRSCSRTELVCELSRRFDQLETADLLAASRNKLLDSRRGALDAAVKKLEKTRIARVELAAQVEALESQFRLIQAQASASVLPIDGSKLARTQKLLAELQKRLAVAQKVLAQEARFIESDPIEAPTEAAVVERVDKYLAERPQAKGLFQ